MSALLLQQRDSWGGTVSCGECRSAHCPAIAMLPGKLQGPQMVLSAFQGNQTTGARAVLTYSSHKTVWRRPNMDHGWHLHESCHLR